jgi:hypothetical protein
VNLGCKKNHALLSKVLPYQARNKKLHRAVAAHLRQIRITRISWTHSSSPTTTAWILRGWIRHKWMLRTGVIWTNSWQKLFKILITPLLSRPPALTPAAGIMDATGKNSPLVATSSGTSSRRERPDTAIDVHSAMPISAALPLEISMWKTRAVVECAGTPTVEKDRVPEFKASRCSVDNYRNDLRGGFQQGRLA